jgi:hypothetical protein
MGAALPPACSGVWALACRTADRACSHGACMREGFVRPVCPAGSASRDSRGAACVAVDASVLQVSGQARTAVDAVRCRWSGQQVAVTSWRHGQYSSQSAALHRANRPMAGPSPMSQGSWHQPRASIDQALTLTHAVQRCRSLTLVVRAAVLSSPAACAMCGLRARTVVHAPELPASACLPA